MFHPCNTSLSNNRSWRPKDRKLRNTNSKNYIAVNGGRYHSCCRWHQQTIKAIILSLKPIYPRFFSSFQNNLFPFRANSNAGNIVYDKSKIMIAFYIDADGLGLKLVSYWIWLLQHLLCFIQNATELGISRKLFHDFIITNIIQSLYYIENYVLSFNL